MPPTNTAAYLIAPKTPLEIRSAPYTSPKTNELVIRNHAIAINPIDWLKVELGNMLYSWLKNPCVLGIDVSGEVVEVGPNVTRFKPGDRVLGHAVGIEKSHNTSAGGAFQKYTVLLAHMTSVIPESLPYESAAVLPLGLSTAACGLFQKDQLALQLPTVPSAKPTGKTLLVWGGSTSVGSNAIQLAVAAGYEVFTTCSPRNFEYVKKLGASQAFDYNSKTTIADLIQAFKGKTTAGAMSIGPGAAEACLDILNGCQGDKFLSMASYPMPPTPPNSFVMLNTMTYFLPRMANIFIKAKTRGIRIKFIWGASLMDNEVGPAMYDGFLPEALVKGRYVAAPEPRVVGKGLEFIQVGLDTQRKGVSAKKIVVSL